MVSKTFTQRWWIAFSFKMESISCDALRNLVSFVQFKTREKHSSMCYTPPWVFFTCSEGSFMYSIDFFNYNHFVTKIEFMKEFANFLGEQGFLIFIPVRVLWIFDKPFFIYCFFKLELKLVEIVGKLLSVTLLLKGKSRSGSLKPSKEIAFIWLKNHVVLWKPFRYYRKIMSKGAFTCKQDKFHQRIKLHPKMKVFLFTCSIHSGTKNVLFA